MTRILHRIAVVAVVTLLLSAPIASATVKTEEIKYRVGDAEFTGYLAYDDAVAGKRPGVLVVHEWWGLNDYPKQRAEMLAKLGYTAFAVDMYGTGKVADHPDNAKAFATAATADMGEAEKRFDAAAAILKSQPTVDADKIAAIGYCFGGGIVLHMARTGRDLDGVVSYHGSLGAKTPAAPGRVKSKVLVFTGAADPMVPAAQVAAFEEEMKKAGADYRVKSYPGATHAFTNPGADALAARFKLPLAYDPAADADSWAETLAFFKAIGAAPPPKAQ